MTKLGTVVLDGYSGLSYTFGVYDLNDRFVEAPAVYVVIRASGAGQSERHIIVYIGETDNLKQRFVYHNKQPCFSVNRSNRLCAIVEHNEDTRREIEGDLIAYYNPPGNS